MGQLQGDSRQAREDFEGISAYSGGVWAKRKWLGERMVLAPGLLLTQTQLATGNFELKRSHIKPAGRLVQAAQQKDINTISYENQPIQQAGFHTD
jgi:hypothetical protein